MLYPLPTKDASALASDPAGPRAGDEYWLRMAGYGGMDGTGASIAIEGEPGDGADAVGDVDAPGYAGMAGIGASIAA